MWKWGFHLDIMIINKWAISWRTWDLRKATVSPAPPGTNGPGTAAAAASRRRSRPRRSSAASQSPQRARAAALRPDTLGEPMRTQTKTGVKHSKDAKSSATFCWDLDMHQNMIPCEHPEDLATIQNQWIDDQFLEMCNPFWFNIRSKSLQFAAVWDFLPASTAVAAELPVPVIHSKAMGTNKILWLLIIFRIGMGIGWYPPLVAWTDHSL